MKHPKPNPRQAPDGLFNARERNRMLAMAIGTLLLGGLIIYTFLQSKKYENNTELPERQDELMQVVESVPEIDRARLAELVSDSGEADRVLLRSEVLDAAFEESSVLVDALFEPLGGVLVDSEVVRSLSESAADHRGELYRVRGWVEGVNDLGAGRRGKARTLMMMQLESGEYVYVAVHAIDGEQPVMGDYVRVDGLFVQRFRTELESGDTGESEWIDAPLFVAPRGVRSYPRLEAITQLREGEFAGLVDDSPTNGFHGLPHEEFWRLASFAKHLPADELDWDKAPELTRELITDIYADGDAFRALPVRLPVCKVLAVWNEDYGENPMRIGKMTEAWLGHGNWNGTVQVARIVAPWPNEVIAQGDYVKGRGFFLKNWGYQKVNGDAGIAPYFIMHTVDPFHIAEPLGLRQILWIGAIGIGSLFTLIWVLLRKDRKKALALQEELRRRRKQRRERLQTHPS